MPDYRITKCKTAEDFLRAVSPGNDHFSASRFGDLAYRGQLGAYALTPKAFRSLGPNGSTWLQTDPSLLPARKLTEQISAEITEAVSFIRLADQAGLPLPPFEALLEVEALIGSKNHDPMDGLWPSAEHLQALAIAQHHGIPTRLLDFTNDHLVAAFFCGWEGFKRLLARAGDDSNVETTAVWIIDLQALRLMASDSAAFGERIVIVQVPSADNTYLRSQKALFLSDLGVNDEWLKGHPRSIEEVIANRALRHGLKQVPIWKIDLPITESPQLLMSLDDQGVNLATMMPAHDKVQPAMELKKLISEGAS